AETQACEDSTPGETPPGFTREALLPPQRACEPGEGGARARGLGEGARELLLRGVGRGDGRGARGPGMGALVARRGRRIVRAARARLRALRAPRGFAGRGAGRDGPRARRVRSSPPGCDERLAGAGPQPARRRRALR